MAKRQLSEQRQRFVDEYLIDLNGTQAAIRAGYSPKTAQEQASRLLSNVMVQQAVAERMAERSRRTGVNQDRIILELAKIGFAKITDVIDSDTAKIKADASADDLACIQSVKIKPNEWGIEREIRLYDKKSALELLGKHFGMFKDKLDINMDMDLNISIDYGEDDPR